MKKTIYFLHPPELGPTQYRQDMERICGQLKVFCADVFEVQTPPKNMRTLPHRERAEQVFGQISECDAVVCDISQPSIFIGIVIGSIGRLKKPLLLIYSKNMEPQIESFVFAAPEWNEWVLIQSYGEFTSIVPTIRDAIVRLFIVKKPV